MENVRRCTIVRAMVRKPRRRDDARSPGSTTNPEGAPRAGTDESADSDDSAESDDASLDHADPDPAELDAEVSPDLPPVLESDDAGDEDGERDARVARPALVPTAQRSLARYDPLSRYIEEVRRYPLLTREEEHALA